MRYGVLSLILLFAFTSVTSASGPWISNSSIVTELGDVGVKSTPSVYIDGGILKLISGEQNGVFHGYQWTGSSWVSNSSIVTGLVGVGSYSTPAVYTDGGVLKLISGEFDGVFNGYQWTGSSWVSNSSVVAGLGDVGYDSAPEVYTDGGILKLISGDDSGVFNGYQWTGSSWVSNSSIVAGLSDVGFHSSPAVYTEGGVLKLISGEQNGVFHGYQWTGSSWVSNSSVVAGLGDVGSDSTPAVYADGDILKLISGENFGVFYGYQLNIGPFPPTSFTNLATNLIDHTPTIIWTKGTDVDGDTVSTYIYVGTNSTPTTEEGNTTAGTFNLGTNISLSDGITYYYRLRSYDGYLWSDYTSADQFRMNTVPIVDGASISPAPANTTVDLIALNGTASDSESDVVTLFYKWYKNETLQPSLNTYTVLSDNTSASEVWKVGIIPNDGYENGTEVLSATLTIDSPNVAPILTGIEANASIKYNKTILISTLGASDPNGDNYTLSIGSTSGATDLCVNGNVPNGTQATCAFLVPWTSGTHAIYGFLNDSEDTSIIYSTVVTVDNSPPVIGTTSLSSTSALTGENVTMIASVTVADGSISTVYAVVNGVNYAMSGSGGTYSYIFTSNAGGDFLVTYSAVDDSGNVGYKLTPDAFALIPSEGSGGGGGGSTTVINETVLGDLELTPNDRDVYFFYTGDGEWQDVNYTYDLNRVITSCKVEPNKDAWCQISPEYADVVTVFARFNGSQPYYDGVLTVVDADGFVQSAKLTIRAKNVYAAKYFESPVYVGKELAELLKPFAPSDGEGNLTGMRWWFLFAALAVCLWIIFTDMRRS